MTTKFLDNFMATSAVDWDTFEEARMKQFLQFNRMLSETEDADAIEAMVNSVLAAMQEFGVDLAGADVEFLKEKAMLNASAPSAEFTASVHLAEVSPTPTKLFLFDAIDNAYIGPDFVFQKDMELEVIVSDA
ncbi:unnamed protein product [Prorocentrum cordatum]|uniref:FACT complex subunit n=1 Tax=Prorocentrum cordatum TaxID=2364126 RepID=A0ABN9TZP9_9DINO|nr:unnamed protein product [Polarella glacialis]